MSALKPDVDGTHDLGTTALRWRQLHVDTFTTATTAQGGTDCTVGTNLVVTGNLTVNGDTTTLSTTQLVIEDKTITLASGAGNSGEADGAGITVAGASATLIYDDTGTQWEFNKNVETAGSLLPEGTGKANFNLGSVAQPWNDLFLSNAGVINFANTEDPIDGSDLTLTHSAGALTLGSTAKLQFNDSGTYINSSANGQLDLSSDGTGESALKFAASAGGVDIDAAAARDVNIAGGQVALVSKDNAPSAISLTANQGANETIVITNTQGEADGAISLVATAGGILLDQDSATKKIHLDSEGAVDIDAAAGISIDSVGAAANFSVASDADAEDLTIALTGATDSSVHISSTGTAADALTLTTSAGGIDITVAGAAGEEDLDLTSNTAINLTSSQDAVDAIVLSASSGGIDLTAAEGKDLDISGGQVLLSSRDGVESAIALTTNVGTDETIVVTNTQGTGADAISLVASAGGITATVADGKDLTLGNAASDAYFKVAASGTAGDEDVRIVNTNGTDAAAIELTATAGGILLNTDSASKKIHLDSEGFVDIDAVAGLSIDCDGAAANFTVTADSAGEDLTISQDGSVDASVHISSAGTAADALTVSTSAGGIDITVAGAAADEDLDLTSSTSINLTASEDAADAIVLSASSGGIDLTAAAGKDLDISGGQVNLSSRDNAPSAIALTTNQGSTETIVVTNTQGEDAGAISLVATAGGILLDQDSASKKIHLDSEGFVDIDAIAGLSIDCDGAAANFTVTADSAGEDLTISQDGSVDASVHISSAGTAADALTVSTSAGGIDITVAGAAADEDLDLTSNTSINLAASEDAADAIVLSASAGGVDIDAAATKDVNIAGGQVALVSKDDAASAISLTTDQGTSETIVVTNTQGEGAGAIALTASAGGIALTSAGSVVVDSDAFDITSDQSADPLVRIVNTENDPNGSRLRFVKDKGAVGAANDVVGIIEFFGDNDRTDEAGGQEQIKFAEVKAQVSDASDGAEGGKLTLSIASHDGELVSGLILADGDAEDEIDVTIGSGSSSLTTVAGGLTVTGGLTVNGTMTTVSTTDLEVTDKQILIAKGNDSLANADSSGLYIDVTGGTDLHWRYKNNTSAFTANTSIDLDSAGSVYKIQGTEVIGASGAKKVHSDVAGAGLAHSGGVLSLNIDGLGALGGTGLSQDDDHFVFSDNGTEKKISFSNLEDAIFSNVSGDATVAAGGTLTIVEDAIHGAMLNTDIISTQAEMTGDVADADEILISDGGVLKRADFSVLRDAVFNDVSGDATVAAGGALTIADDAVQGAMLNTDIISAQAEMTGDIDDTDEILISDNGAVKRADFSVLRDAVFNDVSGDASVADGGALTIANGAVEHGMLNDNIISGQAELAHADIANDDDLMIHDSDAAVVKKVGVDSLMNHYFAAISGNASVADGGALTIANDAVINDMILNDHITLAADSGDNVDLHLGDTFTIAGTAGEIETSVSGDTITVGLPNNVDVDGTLDVGGIVNLTDTTASTSSTTGALKVAGGVGIAGRLHVASPNAITLIGAGTSDGFIFDMGNDRLSLEDKSFRIRDSGDVVFNITSAGAIDTVKGITTSGDDTLGNDDQDTLIVNSVSNFNSLTKLKSKVSFNTPSELTISTGAVTATQSYHKIDTEGDAASDNLDTIEGGVTGMIIILQSADSSRTVVLKDGTGNLKLAGDCSLNNTEDTVQLVYNGSNWCEITRSDNG